MTSGWAIFTENIWCTLLMENKQTLKKRKLRPRKGALFASRIKHQKRMTDLNITTEGEIAAFLAF